MIKMQCFNRSKVCGAAIEALQQPSVKAEVIDAQQLQLVEQWLRWMNRPQRQGQPPAAVTRPGQIVQREQLAQLSLEPPSVGFAAALK